ncbi:hypothetical protein MKEN_00781100 [Mycena kentingensis (nom. inval.)]|nr:hypothetical protein MKEN_00781100 [Mycena kentingensis (nom. inval.)]
MLASLFLVSAVLRACSAATFDLTSADVTFTPGWTQESRGNASFLQAGEFLCAMTADLPPRTSLVTYFGFGSPGSQYGYTLDCESPECLVNTVNGTGSGDATSSEIFKLDMDPSTEHTLRVYNLGTDDSKINFDRLSVLVQDNAGQDSNPGGISTTVSNQATSSTRGSTPRASAFVATGSAPASGSPTTPTADTSLSPSTASTPASSGSSDPSTNTGSASTGPSKRLIGALVGFAVAVTLGILIMLFICLRRRRRERRALPQGPPSPTSSIIPIMEPPQMRTASLNPFSDPSPFAEPPAAFPNPYAVPQVPFDTPYSSSIMQQRRQRSDSASRSASPSSAAPTIPLPELPAEARTRGMGTEWGVGGRSDSPASSNTQNNLWITRTPVKSQFSFAV